MLLKRLVLAMSIKTTNVMLVGVGGQGVLLASELICAAVMAEGYDVKKSEVHGMAQRGGSVVSNVRFGEKVYSPLITKGEADILLSFEQVETLRWFDYLHETSVVIMNLQKIMPVAVTTGKENYPENIPDLLSRKSPHIYPVDAREIARTAGNMKTVNVALTGAFSNHLDLPEKHWKSIIEKNVPPKTLVSNLKAFELGRAN